MAKSRLVVNRNRKKATILSSKRTVEDAIRRANQLASVWMEANSDDPRVEELQRIVDHLSGVLKMTPQQMRADGMASIEDYFDDANNAEIANTIKREVNMIAKWHDEQRGAQAQPAAPRTPEQMGVGDVPNSAVAERGIHASEKKADGAGFSTDRDEKGEPKAPVKLEVPRLAKKKKEAVPEPAAPVDPVAPVAEVPAAPVPAAGGGKVNPIEYIPTEALIKVIEGMPKEDDFAQNKEKQDALIALTEILKQRPILPPEPAEGAAPVAPAPAAPLPVAASKKADYGDHAVGGNGNIGDAPSSAPAPRSTPISPARDTGNPAPEKAVVDLGGLSIASSLEEDKTADDYRLHDYKLQDEGLVPSGKMPNMEEQEQHMHPEEGEFEMESGMYKESVTPPGISEATMHHLKEEYPGDKEKAYATAWSIHNKQNSLRTAAKVIAAELDKLDKVASGANSGGWYTSYKPLEVDEDGGRTPEIGEAHSMLEDHTGIDHPATTMPIKLNKQAGEMSTSKAVKQSESIGNDLKKMYLDAKSLTTVNDTRPVREAVEAIFRAADMFDEATKTLNKQNQQEESEAAAQEIKAKNKKSSFEGLALAAAE